MPEQGMGPSAGVLGKKGSGIQVDRRLVRDHAELARKLLTFGKQPRAGHDRARWEGVNWQDYRARVGVPDREGPWLITVADSTEGTVSETVHRWVAEAEDLPWEPGVYTTLEHDQRGLVMSDLPGEIAGTLPFLDHVAQLGGRVLIAGLGLGIVPAWLLEHTAVERVDVIEVDEDLTRMVTRAAASCCDQPGDSWAADPRLHIHHGDAHTWQPPRRARYDAAWLDIWDLVSADNLPSMDLLEARYAPACKAVWSWERPECEAMLARGQTVEAPSCRVDETGYPIMEKHADD